jgi:2,4-dienoyl-CoA reductase-like NADH-dependent reductase (Old Yellow Enzyme family)
MRKSPDHGQLITPEEFIMKNLFDKTEIKGLKLSNRFARSATWEGMAASDGQVTPRLTDLMVQLARGGVALIISSHAYVRRDGQAGIFQLGIYDDHLVPALGKMVSAVHEEGGKIVAQLAHAGFMADPKLIGQTPLAVSQVDGFASSPRKVMTIEDIRGIAAAFGQAAGRAKAAGFDGVQIHAAHGYLMSQFLSPAFNKRTDEYGGPVGNRAKALLEALKSIRSEVGKGFPVLAKMNCEDYLEGGLTLPDSLKAGSLLEKAGLDAIELSGGTLVSGKLSPSRTGIKTEDKEAYFREAARQFKKEVTLPLILVGGVRSPQVAEKLVREGYADYLSMSRPLIREPDLVKRWQSGDRSKAKCVSDNQCFDPGKAGEGIYCVVDRKAGK